MKHIKIDGCSIGPGIKTFIIAEAGVNHNHKLGLALRLVDAAASAGADAIKFQTFKAEQVVTVTGVMAEYQKKNLGVATGKGKSGETGVKNESQNKKNESQFDMLRKLEFGEDWYPKVIERCKKRNIMFLSTPHGSFASIDLLANINIPAFKFGSGDLTSLPLLAYAAKHKKPVILGTGMATMREVKDAIQAIQSAGNNNIIVLHCTTNYPCPPEEVNLRAMQTMMKKFPGVIVGYSDHTLGTQVPVMAVALGAQAIEKHLTLDTTMPGPDHKASADPATFKKMVDEIRVVETILGSSEKKPLLSEIKNRPIVRRSIVATRDIKKGEIFSLKNLDLKRPGIGMSPALLPKVLGKKAKADVKAGSFIKKSTVA